MASITISIGLNVEAAEADGSKCICCGDMIFMKAYALRPYQKMRHEDRKLKSLKGLLCQSCGESLKNKRG